MKCSNLQAVLILVALVAVLGYFDFEAEVAAQERYCSDVKEGVQPDYNGIYKEVCEPTHGKAKNFKEISI